MSLIRDIWAGERGRELAGVGLAGAALLLLVALASYSPQDPAFSVAAGGPPANWAGPAGAHVSGLLFEGLGLAAWFVPFVLGSAALRRFRPGRARLRGSAALGLTIVALSTALLLALAAGDIAYRGGGLPAGGLVGYLGATALAALLSDVGSWIVAATLLMTGLVLAARSSLAETTGAAADAVRRAAPRVTRPAGRAGGGLLALGRRGAASLAGGLAAALRTLLRSSMALLRSSVALLRSSVALPRSSTALLRSSKAPFRRSRAAQAQPGHARPAAMPGTGRLPAGGDELDRDVDDLADADGDTDADASDDDDGYDDDGEAGAAEADEENEGEAEADDEGDGGRTGPRPKTAPKTAKKKPAPAQVPRQATLPVEIPRRSLRLPPIELLAPPPPARPPDKQELAAIARQIESRCAEFSVDGQIMGFHPGPVVTTYEFRPNAGIKVARITALADDLALGLEAESVRVDRLPGRSTVGIEVPNKRRETIALREILESDVFRRGTDILTVALGKSQEGEIVCASLAKMPHVLVAGATGSGKSVGLNGVITSILYRAKPDQVKFILIDPKMLELGLYDGIPHLLVPVVTDMKAAGNALKWAVREMERRYRLLAACNVRHLDAFNKLAAADPGLVQRAITTIPVRGEGEKYEARTMPYVIIVVDELADMLMTTGQDVEESIARLAQKARAVGIHLVLATQRPSVDVLTGSIKANFPARIAYRVASKIDSRTILDASGAERLLGAGDMLYRQPGSARLLRVHGAFVSEDENLRVVQWLKNQAKAEYDTSILEDPPEAEGENGEAGGDIAGNDPMYRKAVRLVIATGQASTSFLQRKMKLGYSRAARIIDQMEQDGIVGKADGSKPRQVLADSEFLERMDQQEV